MWKLVNRECCQAPGSGRADWRVITLTEQAPGLGFPGGGGRAVLHRGGSGGRARGFWRRGGGLGAGVRGGGAGAGRSGACTLGGATRSGPRRLAPSSLPRALAKAARALPLGADRAAAAAAASRALSRPAPQGPSVGPVHAPPSRGPGGPAPVPRGPRLLVPAAPGARSPARAAPLAAGERGRGKAGPGAGSGDRAAPRSRTMRKPRAAAEPPGPSLPLRPCLGLGPAGPGGRMARTDAGRRSGPRARRAPRVGGRPGGGRGGGGVRGAGGGEWTPSARAPRRASRLGGWVLWEHRALPVAGWEFLQEMQIRRQRKFVFGGPLQLHPWSLLSRLYLKAYRFEMELSDPWRTRAPSRRGARNSAAQRLQVGGSRRARCPARGPRWWWEPVRQGVDGGDSSPSVQGAGRAGKRRELRCKLKSLWRAESKHQVPGFLTLSSWYSDVLSHKNRQALFPAGDAS